MRSRTALLTVGLLAALATGLTDEQPARADDHVVGRPGHARVIPPTTTEPPPTTQPELGSLVGVLSYSPAAPFRLELMDVSLLLEVSGGSAWDLGVSMSWDLWPGRACSGRPGNPVELTGNTDGVLQPGEQWRYDFDCLGGEATLFALVSGNLSGGEASFSADITARRPLVVVVEPEATLVPVGELARWEVAVENVGPYPFQDVVAMARDIWSDSVEYQSLGAPVAGNLGDAVLDPGETWMYSYEATMTGAEQLVEAVVDAAPVHAADRLLRGSSQSEVVGALGPTTSPPPSTTGTTTTATTTRPVGGLLPVTGSGSTPLTIGVLLLVAGLGAAVVGRRRVASP